MQWSEPAGIVNRLLPKIVVDLIRCVNCGRALDRVECGGESRQWTKWCAVGATCCWSRVAWEWRATASPSDTKGLSCATGSSNSRTSSPATRTKSIAWHPTPCATADPTAPTDPTRNYASTRTTTARTPPSPRRRVPVSPAPPLGSSTWSTRCHAATRRLCKRRRQPSMTSAS